MDKCGHQGINRLLREPRFGVMPGTWLYQCDKNVTDHTRVDLQRGREVAFSKLQR